MEELLQRFTNQSKEIIRDNLVGVYLHGSAVMGCFNPQKSDIDLIIVVKKPLSDADKRAYMDMVVELNASAPAKGIEMSIVRQAVCSPFVYPTPFELHFSVAHLEWYKSDPADYIRKMTGTDKDLAAHFTIIYNLGKCLYGAPIKDVFSAVPMQDYIDSIWNDICDAEEEISENPMYLILNLARVLAYLKDGLILSKKEGGEWGLKNLPEEYHSLFHDALDDYSNDKAPAYDLDIARSFAKYMLKHIKEYR